MKDLEQKFRDADNERVRLVADKQIQESKVTRLELEVKRLRED